MKSLQYLILLIFTYFVVCTGALVKVPKLFQVMDRNEDLQISLDEIVSFACQSTKICDVPKEELLRALHKIDRDHSNTISLQEWPESLKSPIESGKFQQK